MAYAGDGPACWSTLDNGGEHVHQCEFAAGHTDEYYDGSHQCECGEVW